MNKAILLAALIVAPTAVVAAMGANAQMREERRFATRCGAIAAGTGMDAVRTKATAVPGYVTQELAATGWSGPITVISPPETIWPRSVCTVRHDSANVLSASWDPWYE
jgi:hypothetical protein